MHCFDHHADKYMALANVIGKFWNLYQGRDMSNMTFLDKFNNAVEIVEEHGGNIAKHTAITVNEYPEGSMTNKEEEHAITRAKEKFLSRYERLVEELHNEFLKGQNNYPDTVSTAYDLINRYMDMSRQRQGGGGENGAIIGRLLSPLSYA
eukprot:5306964-Ditylum_brightwellii.AAC.1